MVMNWKLSLKKRSETFPETLGDHGRLQRDDKFPHSFRIGSMIKECREREREEGVICEINVHENISTSLQRLHNPQCIRYAELLVDSLFLQF
jgi:hypothetical protein